MLNFRFCLRDKRFIETKRNIKQSMKYSVIKTIFTFSIILFYFLHPAFANNPDNIAGKWITPEGKSIILIEYKEGKYTGKILRIHPKEYINNAPPKDLLNINPNLRYRSLEGLVIFSGFNYDKSKERWNIELIYDPERGKYFEGHISLKDRNQLIVRGFTPGKRWLGNTEIWKRVEGRSPI